MVLNKNRSGFIAWKGERGENEAHRVLLSDEKTTQDKRLKPEPPLQRFLSA